MFKIKKKMIINKQTNEVLRTGEDTSKKATINPEEIAKLQYILTKGLYSDGESAVIVEWANNAIDSVIQSGKDITMNPVIVELTEKFFRVSDTGLGLTIDEFESVVMNYLTSTKSNSNETIGSFGLGCKSFVSLDRSATFTMRKDGVESKVIAYLGDEFLEYDLIYTKDTDIQNGVVAEIGINNYSEFARFRDKCKNKLAFYDNVILQIQDSIVNNQIIRSEDWQQSNLQPNKMQLCLKDVTYDIDWDKLGMNTIYMPIALRFNLDSGLTPTPSRQSLIWNQFTIELVKDKIKKVSDWFINKYNENWKEFDSILEVWDRIDDEDYSVILNSKSFNFEELLPISNLQIIPLKVKDISLNELEFYKKKKYEFLDEYSTIATYDSRTWSTRNLQLLNITKLISKEYLAIQVNSVPSGNFKSYLLDKYNNKRLRFIKKVEERTLETSLNFKNIPSYSEILGLINKPKEEWQPLINEWNKIENEFKSLIFDETGTQTSKEYLDWLEKEKENRKILRAYNPGNHKVLNKQDDEVTIAFGRKRSIGKGIMFEKETFKVNKLSQTPKLTIYFEDKEKATQYYELIGKKYKIALVGKREQSKIKNIHNFMTEQEFQKSKVFKRIVTSVMFDELIETYRSIYSRSSLDIIQNLISPLEEDIEILQNYTSKNGKTIRDNELLDSMVSIAKEYNLYDYQFMDVYNRCKESLDKYKFLNYIQKPDRWNEENVKEVNSIITQFLYHQKMYRGLHQELEFVVKEQEIVENLELEIVE